jgi:hypothetical protein
VLPEQLSCGRRLGLEVEMVSHGFT